MGYNPFKGDLPGTPKDMGPPKMVSGTHTIPILLMEEILHHLGCINPVNNGINYHINWLAGFLPSTVPFPYLQGFSHMAVVFWSRRRSRIQSTNGWLARCLVVRGDKFDRIRPDLRVDPKRCHGLKGDLFQIHQNSD